MGSIPGPGGSHMPWSGWSSVQPNHWSLRACAGEPGSHNSWDDVTTEARACAPHQEESAAVRHLLTATKSSPHLPQLEEKAHWQQNKMQCKLQIDNTYLKNFPPSPSLCSPFSNFLLFKCWTSRICPLNSFYFSTLFLKILLKHRLSYKAVFNFYCTSKWFM